MLYKRLSLFGSLLNRRKILLVMKPCKKKRYLMSDLRSRNGLFVSQVRLKPTVTANKHSFTPLPQVLTLIFPHFDCSISHSTWDIFELLGRDFGGFHCQWEYPHSCKLKSNLVLLDYFLFSFLLKLVLHHDICDIKRGTGLIPLPIVPLRKRSHQLLMMIP